MSLKKMVQMGWEKVFIFFGVLAALLPISPINMHLTYRDSGVFLYTGWRILHGEVPYRDIWDHKPPIVFYIDALGLWLSNNSRWGVWAIEFIALIFAAITGFYLLKKAFGTMPSAISLTLWLLSFVFVIEGGNLTEEYALPLQFLSLWLAYDIDKPTISPWRYFLIGLIGALAFFTKQPTIGISIAIIIYTVFQGVTSHQIKRLVQHLFFFFAGALVITCSIVIFFAINDSLLQFWSAVFDFNFAYSSAIEGLGRFVRPITSGIKPLKSTGLFQIAMLGYVFSIIYTVNKVGKIGKPSPLLIIGIIALPIELILLCISGRTYYHYYITFLPILSLFAGVTFWIFYSKMLDMETHVKFILTIGFIGTLLWTSIYEYRDTVYSFRWSASDTTVIDYLKTTTTPNEYVLLWGAGPTTNYFAQRKSPTRFVYLYPLYQKGYANEQMVIEFLDDIIQNRPKLIIDTKDPTTPLFDFQIHSTTIDASILYIKSHYFPIIDIGSWTIYRLVDTH